MFQHAWGGCSTTATAAPQPSSTARAASTRGLHTLPEPHVTRHHHMRCRSACPASISLSQAGCGTNQRLPLHFRLPLGLAALRSQPVPHAQAPAGHRQLGTALSCTPAAAGRGRGRAALPPLTASTTAVNALSTQAAGCCCIDPMPTLPSINTGPPTHAWTIMNT